MGEIDRIYHRWDLWECYENGFYSSSSKGLDGDTAREMYSSFLSDSGRFKEGIKSVFSNWFFSCENFLTNSSINRVAWIGQSSACISMGLPSCYRSGFYLMSKSQQDSANKLAQESLEVYLMVKKRIKDYVRKWESQGYSDGIPDEVPDELMKLGIAPSYKEIAICILKNDLQLTKLGFSSKKSAWYDYFKKREFESLGRTFQYDLFDRR